MISVSNLLGTSYVPGTDSASKDAAVGKVNNPCALGASGSVTGRTQMRSKVVTEAGEKIQQTWHGRGLPFYFIFKILFSYF